MVPTPFTPLIIDDDDDGGGCDDDDDGDHQVVVMKTVMINPWLQLSMKLTNMIPSWVHSRSLCEKCFYSHLIIIFLIIIIVIIIFLKDAKMEILPQRPALWFRPCLGRIFWRWSHLWNGAFEGLEIWIGVTCAVTEYSLMFIDIIIMSHDHHNNHHYHDNGNSWWWDHCTGFWAINVYFYLYMYLWICAFVFVFDQMLGSLHRIMAASRGQFPVAIGIDIGTNDTSLPVLDTGPVSNRI